MSAFLKRLFCRHEFEFVRNIHGDEIVARGWKRSLWRCTSCGKVVVKDELHSAPSLNGEFAWRPVSDEMPPLSDFRPVDPTKPRRVRSEVLVATLEGRVFATISTGLGFANIGYSDEVTYWMPMPDHPALRRR